MLSQHIITGLLLIVVGYLLLDGRTPAIPDEGFQPVHCKKKNPFDCPGACSGRGVCVGTTCKCADGYLGEDCSQEHCPLNCSRRGNCIDGYCVCDHRWGGTDCSVDRLYIFRNQLLENVDLELTFESTCAFLTLDSLRPYGGNYTVYSTGIDGQQEEYFVSEDMQDVLPEDCPDYHFSTCAVVGNSGSLRYGDKGDEIDDHAMIYRFNQAPTLGYEKYVGNKTTFESLNAKFAHMLRHDDSDWEWRDPPAIFVMFEPFRLKETYVHIRTQFPTIESLLFSPEFFAKAHQIYDRLQDNLERFEFGCFTGEKPMSGFYAVLYALSACDQVDLYGFEPWTDAMARGMRHARYHYFNGEEPRPGAHSFDATYMMYELMKTVPDLRLMVNEIPIPTDDEELLARDLVVNDNGLTATAVQDGADLEGEDGVVEHNRDRNGIRERGSRGHSRRSTDWAVRGEMKRSQENTERDEGVEFW